MKQRPAHQEWRWRAHPNAAEQNPDTAEQHPDAAKLTTLLCHAAAGRAITTIREKEAYDSYLIHKAPFWLLAILARWRGVAKKGCHMMPTWFIGRSGEDEKVTTVAAAREAAAASIQVFGVRPQLFHSKSLHSIRMFKNGPYGAFVEHLRKWILAWQSWNLPKRGEKVWKMVLMEHL